MSRVRLFLIGGDICAVLGLAGERPWDVMDLLDGRSVEDHKTVNQIDNLDVLGLYRRILMHPVQYIQLDTIVDLEETLERWCG